MPILLVVDDSAADIDLLRERFAEMAVDVDCRVVRNGEEARAWIGRMAAGSEPRPAAMLVDLNMPRMGGLELLRTSRRDPRVASIPAAIWTSSASVEDRRASEAAGADAYYTKPATLAQLDHLAREVLQLMRLPPPGGAG